MRFALLAGCSFALALAAGAGLAGGFAERQQGTAHAFRDAALAHAPRLLELRTPAASGTTGGTYTTAGGDTVRIFAATEYVAADPSFNQRWADLLGAAPHGAELGRLTVDLLPLARVQSICGADALACYTSNDETIVAPGEDPAPDLPAASILLHEYGHHIAANRKNDPWSAIEYGTKRWASHENICRQTKDGVLHPGNEGSDYELNPGEAWAETYRVVAETALGLPSAGWSIVSHSFYPDDAALAAATEDTVDPWVGNTKTVAAGSFHGAQKQRRLRIVTPYDGALALSLSNHTRSRLTVALTDGSGTVLATAAVASGHTKMIRSSICGARLLQLSMSRRATGGGSYSVTVSKP